MYANFVAGSVQTGVKMHEKKVSRVARHKTNIPNLISKGVAAVTDDSRLLSQSVRLWAYAEATGIGLRMMLHAGCDPESGLSKTASKFAVELSLGRMDATLRAAG